MTEISNKALALLILATLVVVVTATTLQLNGGITGLATEDTGTVNLTIAQNLAIEVDANNNSINFGTCSPVSGVTYSVSSNGSDESNGNCTEPLLATTPQHIQINNVGNINASINASAECPVTDFLPESSVDKQNNFTIRVDSGVSNCDAGEQNTFAKLENSNLSICTTLQPTNNIKILANVTIDEDTQTNQQCGADVDTNIITFTGY